MSAQIKIPNHASQIYFDAADLCIRFRDNFEETQGINKVLRVVVMAFGQVIEDKFFTKDSKVFVGPGSKNTFTIPTSNLKNRHQLIHYTEDNGISLEVPSDAYGAFNIDHDLVTLSSLLKNSGSPTQKIELKTGSRGYIEIGNIVIFFEEITRPVGIAPISFKEQLKDPYFLRWLGISTILHLLFFLLLLVLPKAPETKQVEKAREKFKKIVVQSQALKKSQPIAIIKEDEALRGKSGKEGEGAKASGKEGRRGKGVKGRTGKVSKNVDVGKTGVLSFFNKNANKGVLDDLIGDGSSIAASADKLGQKDARYGLAGERTVREGKGLAGSDSGGGNPNTASIGSGLGTRGKGGGKTNTGGLSDFGTGNSNVAVSASIDDEEVYIQGNIPKSEIARIINNHLGQIRYCYSRELPKSPKLRGKIVINFIIGLQGRVTSTRVDETTMNNANVEQCVQNVVRRMPFPKPGGGVVEVNYPFTFNVAG